MAGYIACICEGGAETAVIDLLLDSHSLIFEREELLEGEVLPRRKGKEFEERYLRKGFSEKITVYCIKDSRSEKFKIKKIYEHKVSIINVITAPEIEMLIVCAEGKYGDYEKERRKNRQLKPSTYCRVNLKLKNVKSYDFVKAYFSDINVLKNALHEYRRTSKIQKDEITLWDLLR